MSLSQEKSEISDKILLKLFNKYGIKKVIDTAITKILESKNDNLSQIINTLLNNIGSENLLQKILLLAKEKNFVLNENENNNNNIDLNEKNNSDNENNLQKKREREMNENNIDIKAIINNIKNISNNNNNNLNNNLNNNNNIINKNEDTESFNEESVSSISNKQKFKQKKTYSSSNKISSYYEEEENESEDDSLITETNNNNNINNSNNIKNSSSNNNKKISDFTEDSIRKYKYLSRMHKVENIKLLEKYERVGKGGFLIPTGENKERFVYAISGLPSKKNIYFRCSDRTCHAKGKIEINEEHSFVLTKQHEKPLQQHSYYVKLNNL